MIKSVSRALAKKENGEKGFTLIELLVVVIIIGILAAVAIPVFLNMREGAWRSSVESDLSNAALSIEAYATNSNGSLSALTSPTVVTDAAPADLDGDGTDDVFASDGNELTITVAGNAYEIVGTNENINGGNDTLAYSSDEGGLAADWVVGTAPNP